MLDNIELLFYIVFLVIGIYLYQYLYNNFKLSPGMKQILEFFRDI